MITLVFQFQFAIISEGKLEIETYDFPQFTRYISNRYEKHVKPIHKFNRNPENGTKPDGINDVYRFTVYKHKMF